MNSNLNTYQLSHACETTGWDSSRNDVNGTNFFNMTPAQVAIQAGNVDEFRAIVSHPQFEPEKMGKVGVFFNVCQDREPERYRVFKQYFDNEFRKNFRFDASRQVFVRAH